MKKKLVIPEISAPLWVQWLLAAWAFFILVWFFTHPLPNWPAFSRLWNSASYPTALLSQRWAVWGHFLYVLVTGFWVTGMIWSCGKRIAELFAIRAPHWATQWGLNWGLGVMATTFFWMGLGLVRLWFEPLWLIAFLGFSFPWMKDLLKASRNLGGLRRFETPHWGFSLLLGLYSLFLLVHCLLPETFYDTLNYFLAMPHYWLFQHGISDYPTHLLSGYFHGGSLFYMPAYVLAGTEGAKVLSMVLWVLCGLFAAGWVRELSNSEGSWITLLAVFTFPLLYLNALAVRVDILLTLSLLLFFYCVQKALALTASKGFEAWVWGAGLFAALAISVKPTAIIGLGSVLIACLWTKGIGPFKRKELWPAFLVPAVLGVGPWFLKNAAFTGNPFFPYAISWMGGRQFWAQGYRTLLAENRQFLPMDHGVWSLLSLPWRLSMPEAGDGQFIGPLILAFLPFLFLWKSKDMGQAFLVRVMVLLFILGLKLSHMLRFSLPAFVLAFMLLSVLFAGIKNPWLKRSWVGALMVCGLLCFGRYLDISAFYINGMGLWSAKATPEAYLERNIPNSYEPAVLWIDANLPKDARLLIVGDARGLYYRRVHYANSVFEEPFFSQAAREAKSPGDILEKLKQLGITDIVVNVPEGMRTAEDYGHYDLQPVEWKRLDDFFHQALESIYFDHHLAVYHVRAQLLPAKGKGPGDPFLLFRTFAKKP